MNRHLCLRAVTGALSVFALLAIAAAGQDDKAVKDKPDAKSDPAAIRKLVELLKSSDFKTREQAARELSKLDTVPDILRDATKMGDAESRRRAQLAIDAITARVEEKEFQAMVADLHRVELDRFVRKMVTDEKARGDKEWKTIEAIVKTVTKRANELGGVKYPVPEFDMKSMPIADLKVERVGFRGKRLLFDHYTDSVTSVTGCMVLTSGTLPRVTGLSNCVIIVDGDVVGATSIDKCLLIVSGKLGRFTGIRDSIILVRGDFGVKDGFGDSDELRGSTSCRSSFIQAKNAKIRFTGCDDSAFVKMIPTGGRNNKILDTDKGPLQMLKFSTKKAVNDDQLKWGKEVNGLTVAIAPGDRPDNFQIRWKNTGKESLELRCGRAAGDPLSFESDDLLNHVFVKGADGTLLPARKPRFPARAGGGPKPRVSTVQLGPGKTYEETIDLPNYVNRPEAKAVYRLSIELEVIGEPPTAKKGATYWTGKVQSNEIEIMFGK